MNCLVQIRTQDGTRDYTWHSLIEADSIPAADRKVYSLLKRTQSSETESRVENIWKVTSAELKVLRKFKVI